MTTITATNIPNLDGSTRDEIFTVDSDGKWRGKFGAMFEDEVIDVCRDASNWREIAAEYFPMSSPVFGSGE